MQVRNELRYRGVAVDDALRHFAGVRGGVTDALDAGNFSDVFDEQREIGGFVRIGHRATIGIDVLPEQGDFANPLSGQIGDFGQHVVEGTRNFVTPGERHDAVGAELAASFHDRHEGGRTVDPGQRQMVEFLDFRKGDINLRFAEPPPVGDQLRQAV